MKSLLRKLIPGPLLTGYHWLLAFAAARWYGRPSERMVVIGVTGTSGKSTVVEMLAAIFQAAGHRVGVASTIRFQAGERSWYNNTKMTMVGRFQLQRWLARMCDAGCRFALVETTSLGIAQHRHIGVHYDTVVLTNLYPEHLDAHAGFANYLQAKRELFAHLARYPRKVLGGTAIERTAIVNLDIPQAAAFTKFTVEQTIGFTVAAAPAPSGVAAVHGTVLREGRRVGVAVDGVSYWLQLPGEHNAANALAALCVARAHGVPPAAIQQGLLQLACVPGRIESINAGQSFTVVVDYAFEPVAMQKLFAVVQALPHRRVIQVLGTTGGGRDAGRGAVLGGMAARFADVVIATDEDPYDDDVAMLIERVASGARAAGKVAGKNLFLQLNRRDAIRQAIQLAEQNDLVLVTGKGSEQTMVVKNGKIIPWDERSIVREEISRKFHQ